MPKLKTGRQVGISLEPYITQLKKPSLDNIYATPECFRYAVRTSKSMLQFASIMDFESPENPKETGFLIKDLDSGKLGWSQDEIFEFKSWLDSHNNLEAWLDANYREATRVVDPIVFITRGSVTHAAAEKPLHADKHSFISQFNIPCFFHFTDERNLDLIRREKGILSLRELRSRGMTPPAFGGNDWSHEADTRIGLDNYVHLCFMDWHPMELFVRNEGRIGTTKFLQIDPSVILLGEVLFTSDVSNKSGVKTLTFEEALKTLDFSAIYGELDLRSQDVMERRKRASKYELLIPKMIPLSHIRSS